ncbi:MAG: 50S ribosomal protein L22 [Terriglobales bacterium]
MAEAMTEFRAEAKWVRVSPQKARLVLDLIKGRRVEDALNTLTFTNKRVAGQVHKVLRSALDNANYLSTEKGVDVDVDNLFVKRAVANEGPRMKRVRPAPQGRAYRYQRRMSHIEIALAEKPRPEGVAAAPRTPAKKAAAKKGAKKTAKKAPAKKFAGKKK